MELPLGTVTSDTQEAIISVKLILFFSKLLYFKKPHLAGAYK